MSDKDNKPDRCDYCGKTEDELDEEVEWAEFWCREGWYCSECIHTFNTEE